MLKKWFVFALCALLACPCALAGHSRDEVRGAYHAITGTGDASPYAQAPSLEAPYDAGALTDAASTGLTVSRTIPVPGRHPSASRCLTRTESGS